MPHLLTTVLGSATALRPEPGPARTWLQRELSRPEYRQGLVDRVVTWLRDLWDGLTRSALGATSLSTAAAVMVLVVLVVLALLTAARVRRDPVRRHAGEPSLVQGQVTADQHRAGAEAALRDAAYGTAVVEAFRALATRAVDRGVVRDRPGLTAHELAADLRPTFAGHAEDIDRCSALFDRVFYGDQPPGEADALRVLGLDDALRQARPGRPSSGSARPDAAVPR